MRLAPAAVNPTAAVRDTRQGRKQEEGAMGTTGPTTTASIAGGPPTPRVDSVAIATRACAVFAFGEASVCCETYRIGGRPGWSFVFERGGFDGFSAEDVALCLHLTGEVAPELAGYGFRGVGHLRADRRRGCFAGAFARVRTGR
jgi:hypothetical protein